MADHATIDDVAEHAGVSIKTVSRVVNGEANVRPATRARVARAVEALGYRPSPSARNLAAQRSFQLALLYDNLSASYVLGIQSGVLDACQRHNYQLLIYPCSYERPGLVEEVVDLARRARIEGLVLTPPLSDLPALDVALDAAGIESVKIAPGQRAAPGHAVYTNDRALCARMTGYLASLGHRRIAFVVGHPGHASVGTRYNGYRDGLAAAGLAFDDQLVAHGLNSFESGVAAARTLLGRRRRPTALFASNDDMAAGALSVAHELGIAVPGELSIAGFDDSPLARQVWPALTTIRQPIFEMSQRATELLLARLRGQPPSTPRASVFESVLVVRDSTGPLASARRRPARPAQRGTRRP